MKRIVAILSLCCLQLTAAESQPGLARASAFALALDKGASASNRHANIILILADDLGWGDLGCYPKAPNADSEAFVPTPHLDRLAASGVRFTDAYAGHMVCAPSRAALMAGRYQHRFGYYGFNDSNAPFPKNIRTLPQSLRAAGYRTALIGKWHVSFATGSGPLDLGFDRFFGFLGGEHDYFRPNIGQPMHAVANAPDAWILDQDKPVTSVKYLTDEFTDRAVTFMKESTAQGQPFFLYLAYNAPHSPLQVPWEDLEPYARERPNGKFTPRDLARAMIGRLDTNVGRLLQFLKENGLEQNTLVALSSDNGGAEQCHNGGLRAGKGYFYEGGLRVPLIIRWPGRLPAGKVFREPVIHLDLYPTFLAAAGGSSAESTSPLDGVNLLPFIEGAKAGPVHEKLYWAQNQSKGKWAIRSGQWKLVNDDTNPYPRSKVNRVPQKLKVQLYDLAADPFEQRDLAEAQPERVASLRKDMEDFQATTKASLFTPEIRAAHRAAIEDRQRDPSLKTLPRRDGAPGHWKGAVSEDED